MSGILRCACGNYPLSPGGKAAVFDGDPCGEHPECVDPRRIIEARRRVKAEADKAARKAAKNVRHKANRSAKATDNHEAAGKPGVLARRKGGR
jgi:hypothetical protein